MPFANESNAKQRNFRAVVTGLKRIGYGHGLLLPGYTLCDWFDPARVIRRVDAAAFGQTPVSSDNACFAVLKANGVSGVELISQFRALGAPRAFEVRDDCVLEWKVTPSPTDRDVHQKILPHEIAPAFDANRDLWKPESVLRAKNIAAPGARQLDFVDLGLIPALEQQVREKLGPLLGGIFHEATKTYTNRHKEPPDWERLCRLVFRSLAGKIMHDRGHQDFQSLHDAPDADDLLARIERHYRDPQPVIEDHSTRALVVQRLWKGIRFENLSVEVLAYIWESTLVSKEMRERQSIHATPSSVARYMVHHLPIGQIPQGRRVVEPCCGSGTFLIAALQRLRELLPPDIDARQRHRYFAQRLAGFDIDAFALEIARSSLMLADFPNPNGWVLEREDVFETPERAPRFANALSKAKIVLCNPPFSDFDESDRRRYPRASLHRPADLLLRVLQAIPRDALLAFVLPRVFLDGLGYRDARRAIADRFEELQIVTLPDKIFRYAQQETALLIACTPRSASSSVSVLHSKVSDADATAFIDFYRITREDSADHSLQDVLRSIATPDLQEVWLSLGGLPTLADATEGIHRGIEWNIPLTERDPQTRRWIEIPQNIARLVSSTPLPGFREGIKAVPRGSFIFQGPSTCYLNVMPEFQRGNAYRLNWQQRKVVFNSKRISRGPWRVAAFADTSGLVCYQAFTCAWPSPQWDPRVIAAILNGPIANAYIAAHEGNRDVTKEIVSKIPMPNIALLDQSNIASLVEDYLRCVGGEITDPGLLNMARKYLREIDALILKAYRLPPRLERQLLDYFQGRKRPVPFEFGDYYPPAFKPYIPLWMYDSAEFRQCTAGRFIAELPRITDPDLREALADL